MQVTDRHHEIADALNEVAYDEAKAATVAAITPAMLAELVADDLQWSEPNACTASLVAELLIAVAQGDAGHGTRSQAIAARMLDQLKREHADDTTKRPREITAEEVAEDEEAARVESRREVLRNAA